MRNKSQPKKKIKQNGTHTQAARDNINEAALFDLQQATISTRCNILWIMSKIISQKLRKQGATHHLQCALNEVTFFTIFFASSTISCFGCSFLSRPLLFHIRSFIFILFLVLFSGVIGKCSVFRQPTWSIESSQTKVVLWKHAFFLCKNFRPKKSLERWYRLCTCTTQKAPAECWISPYVWIRFLALCFWLYPCQSREKALKLSFRVLENFKQKKKTE